MMLLQLTPTFLSLLVFSAHLFRAGAVLLILPLPLLACLLLLPRGWVARVFQALLILVALEWVRTAIFLAHERQEAGEPWVRTAVILGSVALFALAAAALFETETLRRAYPRRSDW